MRTKSHGNSSSTAVNRTQAASASRQLLASDVVTEPALPTPLLNLVLRERRFQGTICYTTDDYRAVIDLMSKGQSFVDSTA